MRFLYGLSFIFVLTFILLAKADSTIASTSLQSQETSLIIYTSNEEGDTSVIFGIDPITLEKKRIGSADITQYRFLMVQIALQQVT